MPNTNEIKAVQITHHNGGEQSVSFSRRNTGLPFLENHDLDRIKETCESEAESTCPNCTYHSLGANCCQITPWKVKITYQASGRYYENEAGPGDCSLSPCIQGILGFDTTNS